jgi:glycosyltransferase involved in cell wall biosynthesis
VRVCMVGQYDPAYPRHAVIRRGLRAAGAEVVECNCRGTAASHAARRRWLLAAACAHRDADLIHLPAFGTSYAGVAKAASRRIGVPLVYDAFTSLYETRVQDRKTTPPWSPKAVWYWFRDREVLRTAHHVLTDTAAHQSYLASTFGISPGKVSVIPVGADETAFGTEPWQPRPAGEWTSVLFYGTYLPLHGIATIVHAAALLNGQAPIRFTIVGSGQTEQAVRMLAGRLRLPNLTARPPVPYAALPDLIRAADICLGIFGTTEKAGRVVPNKVYQALMVGRPVVTRDSPAVREFLVPGEHLLVCEPGDPESLARTLLTLSRDRAQQAYLAQQGQRLAWERFTSGPIGAAMLDALQRVCDSKGT